MQILFRLLTVPGDIGSMPFRGGVVTPGRPVGISLSASPADAQVCGQRSLTTSKKSWPTPTHRRRAFAYSLSS